MVETKSDYGLMILGNQRSGKNYLCNMIIGYERFTSDCRQESITTTAEYHQFHTESTNDLRIYNLPGLIDSNQTKIEQNKCEIMKSFKECPMSAVIFVWRHINGIPHYDDIIAFKAFQQAFNFPSKSLMFIVNNVPSQRTPTFEGTFLTVLQNLLYPISISLQDFCFIDHFNANENDKFGLNRDRFLYFIAQHHEKQQTMSMDIVVQYNQLHRLRQTLQDQYQSIQSNQQLFQSEIQQMTQQFLFVKQQQDKTYHEMIFQLQLTKQQQQQQQDKGMKPGIKQFCKLIGNEKGIRKKVEKTYEIAKNQLHIKCPNDNDDDEQKNCSHVRPVRIGGGGKGAVAVGAVAGAGVGAVAGAAVGGVAGVVCGPCAIATAAAGAAVGAGAGGITGAIIAHHKQKKQCK